MPEVEPVYHAAVAAMRLRQARQEMSEQFRSQLTFYDTGVPPTPEPTPEERERLAALLGELQKRGAGWGWSVLWHGRAVDLPTPTPPEPTPEQIAEHDAWEAEQERQRQQRIEENVEMLKWVYEVAGYSDNGTARSVLRLHSPDREAQCTGCDQGCEDRHDWPCPTVLLIARTWELDLREPTLSEYRETVRRYQERHPGTWGWETPT